MQRLYLPRQILRRGRTATVLEERSVGCTRAEGSTVAQGHIRMEVMPRRPGADLLDFRILKTSKTKRRLWK